MKGYTNQKLTALFLLMSLSSGCSLFSPGKEKDSAENDNQTDPLPADGAAEVSTESTPPSVPPVTPQESSSPTPEPTLNNPLSSPSSAPISPENSAGVTPTPSETPVNPESAASTPSSDAPTEAYTLVAGDTLMKISYETYGDVSHWREIFQDNQDQIKDPNHIATGTQLKLRRSAKSFLSELKGSRYKIQERDTLVKISQTLYGSSSHWKKLWKKNESVIKNPNQIYAGFYLIYDSDGIHHPKKSRKKQVEPVREASTSSPENINPTTTPSLPNTTFGEAPGLAPGNPFLNPPATTASMISTATTATTNTPPTLEAPSAGPLSTSPLSGQ